MTLGVYHRWPDDNTRAVARVFARHLLFTAYDRHEVELDEVRADVFDRFATVPELSAVLPPVHADRAAA